MKQVREGYKMTELGEIPVEWRIIEIDEVVEKIVGGGTPSRDNSDYYKGNIPWFTVKDMDGSFFKDFSQENITTNAIYESAANLISPNNVIIATRIALGRGFINTQEIAINQDLKALYLKDDKVNKVYFLYWYLSKKELIESIGSGSTVKGIRLEQLRQLKLPLPSLQEQQKIAEILSTVDEQIENTEQLIEKTKELKQGLMQQLLTTGIGHTEFKQTELGEIPVEWEVRSIGEVSTVIRGSSPRPKGDPRYYGGSIPRLMVADVTRDKKYVTPKIDYLTDEGAKLSRPMKAGDFVIVCSGTVGLPAILSVDACIHDGFLALKDINKNCSKEYLYYLFVKLRDKLDSSATHGGVFTNLTTQIVKEFSIAIPLIQEQQKIAEILSSVDEQIESYEQEKEKYLQLKKGLMQQLLTGKMRVTV